MELLIPDEYVDNISERLSLYSSLDSLKDEEELTKFIESVRDRFGPLPEPVRDLAETVRLRWLAEDLGFEKLTLKGQKLKAYFLSSDNEAYFKSDIFGTILSFVQQHPKTCRMRDTKGRLILTVDQVETVEQAISIVSQMKGEAALANGR